LKLKLPSTPKAFPCVCESQNYRTSDVLVGMLFAQMTVLQIDKLRPHGLDLTLGDKPQPKP
jgi:hypothetical protein